MRNYVKRDILLLISKRAGLNMSQIAKDTGFSYVTIFNCITLFRTNGFITTRLSGTNRICSITIKGTKELDKLVESCSENR